MITAAKILIYFDISNEKALFLPLSRCHIVMIVIFENRAKNTP